MEMRYSYIFVSNIIIRVLLHHGKLYDFPCACDVTLNNIKPCTALHHEPQLFNFVSSYPDNSFPVLFTRAANSTRRLG